MKKTFAPLDKLINSSGLRYEVISERMGISYNRFWRMRVNPKLMGIEEIEKLADVIGVSFMDVYKVHKNFRMKVDINATREKQPA